MPHCAAAPSSRLIGFAISGPKSVIAPMHMNIRQGKRLLFTPLYIILMIPDWYHAPPSAVASYIRPASGRLAKSMPKAMGSSRSGSNFFSMAR